MRNHWGHVCFHDAPFLHIYGTSKPACLLPWTQGLQKHLQRHVPANGCSLGTVRSMAPLQALFLHLFRFLQVRFSFTRHHEHRDEQCKCYWARPKASAMSIPKKLTSLQSHCWIVPQQETSNCMMPAHARPAWQAYGVLWSGLHDHFQQQLHWQFSPAASIFFSQEWPIQLNGSVLKVKIK